MKENESRDLPALEIQVVAPEDIAERVFFQQGINCGSECINLDYA
jgi:hypothetical protein